MTDKFVTVPKLKPCPFCGSKPTLRQIDDVIGIECGTECDKTGLTIMFPAHKKETAIAAWNRRAAIEADRNKRAEAVMTEADEIVTQLYRRFKDWYMRGFGPDDVTWCEVKADVMLLLSAAQKVPEGVMALEFANHVINGVFEGGDWDGGELQSLAVQYGLLKPQEMQERCGECCCCADNGADFPTICYRKTYRLPTPQPEKKEG